ncbi:MAG: hypothetical protein IKZ04_01790, partial [Spirochaetaceae bacterium]|nr:hypothetical protein [Spirochaetaceae bacterium]
ELKGIKVVRLLYSCINSSIFVVCFKYSLDVRKNKNLFNFIKSNLQNLYIVEHDAIEVLEKMIGDNSVSAFHIFFPDPWPKKKHHKRRLVQHPYTDLFARKLLPGGYICMATDWEPYAEFALEQLSSTKGLVNVYDGYAERQEWRPETRFEEKGKDAQRCIRELYFKKEVD